MKIVYKGSKQSGKKENYQYLCCKEMERLNCLFPWAIVSETNIGVMNSGRMEGDDLIRCGLLLSVLKFKDFLWHGHTSPLLLSLYNNIEWKEIYNILNSIDYIKE